MKRAIAVLLCLALLSAGSTALAAQPSQTEQAAQETAQYLLQSIPSPGVDHAGAVLALAVSGTAVPADYFSEYYNALAARLQQAGSGSTGLRCMDYAEAILALTAIGRDPRTVCGHDLTLPLADYERTVADGLRGAALALLALDCADYELPANPAAQIPATRDLYVNYILNRQLPDGGWSFGSATAKPVATALALPALAAYDQKAGVRGAVLLGVEQLSALQGRDGDFGGAVPCAQVLLALAALGISAQDARFVRDTDTVDALLRYRVSGEGFRHTEHTDLPTTALALQALTAAADGNPFRMAAPAKAAGEMDPGVRASVRTQARAEFQDVTRHPNRAAIEELASYGIINGMREGAFCPDETMTRARSTAVPFRTCRSAHGTQNMWTRRQPTASSTAWAAVSSTRPA